MAILFVSLGITKYGTLLFYSLSAAMSKIPQPVIAVFVNLVQCFIEDKQ